MACQHTRARPSACTARAVFQFIAEALRAPGLVTRPTLDCPRRRQAVISEASFKTEGARAARRQLPANRRTYTPSPPHLCATDARALPRSPALRLPQAGPSPWGACRRPSRSRRATRSSPSSTGPSSRRAAAAAAASRIPARLSSPRLLCVPGWPGALSSLSLLIVSMCRPPCAPQLERRLAPGRPPSSTVAVNRRAQFLPHRDSGGGAGQSTSLIAALGDFTGGELVVEGEVHDVRYRGLEFDGWTQRHWTQPFVGERFSLVWFTPRGLEQGEEGGEEGPGQDGGSAAGDGASYL